MSEAREIELRVIEKIRRRGDVGFLKYGVTLDRKDLSLRQWLTHHQEELMDAIGYIEAALAELPPDPVMCKACQGTGQVEIQSGPYFRKCKECGGAGHLT